MNVENKCPTSLTPSIDQIKISYENKNVTEHETEHKTEHETEHETEHKTEHKTTKDTLNNHVDWTIDVKKATRTGNMAHGRPWLHVSDLKSVL